MVFLQTARLPEKSASCSVLFTDLPVNQRLLLRSTKLRVGASPSAQVCRVADNVTVLVESMDLRINWGTEKVHNLCKMEVG